MNHYFKTLLALFAASLTLTANADPKWYQQIYANNSNSQIVLKDQVGNNVTAITNPTAANVRTNVNTNSQPPNVFVQATATLPVATIGTTCDSTKNTAAISAADRLTLLVCPPTNIWTINNRVSARTVTVGAACDPNIDGNFAVDSSGLALSCQSGSWARQGHSPKAWATWAGGSCAPVCPLDASYGVSSVVRIGSGVYFVSFATGASSATSYAPLVSQSDSQVVMTTAAWYGRSTAGFYVATSGGMSAAIDRVISVVVYGN